MPRFSGFTFLRQVLRQAQKGEGFLHIDAFCETNRERNSNFPSSLGIHVLPQHKNLHKLEFSIRLRPFVIVWITHSIFSSIFGRKMARCSDKHLSCWLWINRGIPLFKLTILFCSFRSRHSQAWSQRTASEETTGKVQCFVSAPNLCRANESIFGGLYRSIQNKGPNRVRTWTFSR